MPCRACGGTVENPRQIDQVQRQLTTREIRDRMPQRPTRRITTDPNSSFTRAKQED